VVESVEEENGGGQSVQGGVNDGDDGDDGDDGGSWREGANGTQRG